MVSWVELHRKNWENPLNSQDENIKGYDSKFLELIQKCLVEAEADQSKLTTI